MSRFEPHFLLFASDAELLALWGVGCLIVALIAFVMERLRSKRARFDQVGFMPWLGLFMAAAVIGGGLLALAVPGMLQS